MKKLFSLVAALFIASISFAQDANDVKMKFLNMLDGTEETAEKAINMYCSPEVIDNGMIPFGSDLKIVETADNCITFILVDDGDENEYYVCSKDGKIVEFNWLELKGL